MRSTNAPFRSNFYLWNGVSAIFFSNYVTNVQLIIYLDTETTAAKAIRERYLQQQPSAAPAFNLFEVVDPNILQKALLKADALMLRDIISKMLNALIGTPPPKPDPRIQTIRTIIDTNHPRELSITALAARIHLSESRLSALFKQHIGIPLYRYILWSKIRFAINRIMTGQPINDAAYEAGFTDNSHFHKMLVSMFGISPSQFLRDNKVMDILTCDASPLNFETTVYDEYMQIEKIYK